MKDYSQDPRFNAARFHLVSLGIGSTFAAQVAYECNRLAKKDGKDKTFAWEIGRRVEPLALLDYAASSYLEWKDGLVTPDEGATQLVKFVRSQVRKAYTEALAKPVEA